MNIAPTKANLLMTKAQLKVAREGHQLLSEKKQVLLMEILTRIHDFRKLESEVQKRIKKAFNNLRKTILTLGEEKIDYLARVYNKSLDFEILERTTMGIVTVDIIPSRTDIILNASLWDTNYYYDILQKELTDVFPLIFKWLSMRITIMRLGDELIKTQKRVNALENIYIPEYETQELWITNILEELSREEFYKVKKLKDKMKRKKGLIQ
ncbi:MAG: V-type ATP synthase subunit D [Candidatus Coatesbacteria bacterium]|nr:V-type ATP synthase subunit D [Candidatus Coatesbacteria bacterium]